MISPKVVARLVAPQINSCFGMRSMASRVKLNVTTVLGTKQHISSKPRFSFRMATTNKKITVSVIKSTNANEKFAAIDKPIHVLETAQPIASERELWSPPVRSHLPGTTMAHIKNPSASA